MSDSFSSLSSNLTSVPIKKKETRQRAVLSWYDLRSEEYTASDVAQLLLDRAAGCVNICEVKHNFCANFSVIRLKTAYLVAGFNISTNKWMGKCSHKEKRDTAMCANFSVIRLKTAYLVAGFNISTNKWMGK
ncbi:unnamed protein product [Protopolystoma xenopodis]|uniref:Uncharacterized protein n=1 Tax=Protopolystoma xenopodis TaxID=117903 RepID=A0A448WP29_9PLAT|nr:unnamed protein product [Protopolystoma xenopodis]